MVCAVNRLETCFHAGRLRHANLDRDRRATGGDEVQQPGLRVPRGRELLRIGWRGFHVRREQPNETQDQRPRVR